MYKPNEKEILLLKLHDEKTYERFHKLYIRSLKLFISLKYNFCEFDISVLSEDAFEKAAYEKINKYNPFVSGFSTWLFNIADNLCIDYIRQRNNEMECLVDVYEIPDNRANTSMLLNDFKRILDDSEYQCIVRHVIDGDLLDDIAKDLNVSKKTVLRRIKSAKEKIKEKMY